MYRHALVLVIQIQRTHRIGGPYLLSPLLQKGMSLAINLNAGPRRTVTRNVRVRAGPVLAPRKRGARPLVHESELAVVVVHLVVGGRYLLAKGGLYRSIGSSYFATSKF